MLGWEVVVGPVVPIKEKKGWTVRAGISRK